MKNISVKEVILLLFALCGASVLVYHSVQGNQTALTAIISIINAILVYYGIKAVKP